MITLAEAVAKARQLEALVTPYGYHIALTGSCLYKGESEKDMDFVVYQHKTGRENFDGLMEMLNASYYVKNCTDYHPDDRKLVYQCQNADERFDLFFLQ